MIKVCPVCGKEFEDKKHPNKKYCSQQCFGINQRKGDLLKCAYCGKEFYKAPSQIKSWKNTFCSNECRHLARKGVDVVYFEKDYAYILLTKNDVTKKILFDIEDIERVNQYKWHLHFSKNGARYDVCTNRFGVHKAGRYMIMSRFIMNYNGNLAIDHINRNPLDNRKKNLRIVTAFENNLNRGNNKSGCVGVCWDKSRNKWRVMLGNKNFGRYDTFEEAVKVRKQVELDYHEQKNF